LFGDSGVRCRLTQSLQSVDSTTQQGGSRFGRDALARRAEQSFSGFKMSGDSTPLTGRQRVGVAFDPLFRGCQLCRHTLSVGTK
jgi:hypothetical protein